MLLQRFTLWPVAPVMLATGGPAAAAAEQAAVLREERGSGLAENDAVTLKRKASTGLRLGLTAQETPAAVTVVGCETLEQRGVSHPLHGLSRRTAYR